MGSISEEYILSEEQKAHFLEHGYVKIPQCFTREAAAKFTEGMWTRLGMSPTDKSTWTTEKTNMPWHYHVSVSEFSPKAWSAMGQLLGGVDRISEKPGFRGWSDGFIVNLGREGYSGEQELNLRCSSAGTSRKALLTPVALDNWHNDGDFFVHFLDSPEQALLVIPLWSDIVHKGGATAICGDGIKYIAKHLVFLFTPSFGLVSDKCRYDHPEGTTPWMRSVNDPTHSRYEGRDFWSQIAWDPSKTRDESFHEATGEVGDVFLLHPLMLHSASKNLLRIPRIITNPPVSLKEPFNFDREDPSEYSLVELKTLKDLGMSEGLKGWKITGPRREWVSNRIKRQEAERLKELERLKGQ
ncbi:uncharacterized protein PAC_02057 [Phialocephala subalpina]|uniref:Phytanoyl-CoA dioxygenase n=1 Tax=Phialocephala subalpina TaxID=576137 RepID=A0A1L7WHC8_9HELO|nr:uncharacterized protein PAC_02057 [Phialocephala subalpina]